MFIRVSSHYANQENYRDGDALPFGDMANLAVPLHATDSDEHCHAYMPLWLILPILTEWEGAPPPWNLWRDGYRP